MSGLLSRITRSWRASGTASGASVGLCLLFFACVLLAMTGPRADTQLQTNAVRQLIARTPADTKVIEASIPYQQAVPVGYALPVSQIVGVGQELRAGLGHLPLAGAAADIATFTSGFNPVAHSAPSLGPGGGTLELIYSTRLSGNARLVRGMMPSIGQLKPRAPRVTLPVAVTEATARRFGLSVGSRLPVGGTKATLLVTGIIQPVGPASAFWAPDPIGQVPSLVTPLHGSPYWQGGAFIGATELVPLENVLGTTNANLRWLLPLRIANLTIGQARALAVALPAALVQDGNGLYANANYPFNATLFSGVAAGLTTFVQQADAINTLLSLLSMSLEAISAAVLLLAIWLLTDQRYGEFEVLRARGASRRQLSLLAVRGCGLAVLLGGGLGAAAALGLTPVSSAALSWWLTAVTVLVVLVGLPVITVRRHRGPPLQGRRPDRSSGRRAAARRLVIEGALVLGSAGGLVLLHDQGLAPGRTDPYASLAPVLVAIPIAVIVLRCYPPAVRPLARLTGRRRGVTAFVGLARSIRTTPAAALPVFALVLALALVAFAGMIRGAVLRGEVVASWQQVGADAAISSPDAISPAAQRAIAALPGVQHSAALTLTTGIFPGSYRQFGVVLVDPRQYATLLAATPELAGSAAALRAAAAATTRGQTQALATGGLGGALARTGTTLDIGASAQPVRVRLTGQVPVSSVISASIGSQYLVLPRSVLGASAGQPSVMVVVGAHLNLHQLAAMVRKLLPAGTSLHLRGLVLAALQSAPLQQGAYTAFALGSAAAAVLSLLVLLLTLVIGARSRQQTLARMSTMGLSRTQGRRLAVLETLPLILAGLIGGAGCAALLGPLVGPSLDLAVFTGTPEAVPVRIEYAVLAATAAGLALLAMLTLTVQTALASRRTAVALRIGE
ncbi:MAG: FtsX-like permease family protein [Streptosporangiaceae bacterium]